MDRGTGIKVRDHLRALGIETPILPLKGSINGRAMRRVNIAVEEIISALGLDIRDDSLRNTPKRVAKMFCQEVFYGLDYHNFPKMTTVQNRMKYDEVIVCKASIHSYCEHHLVPFTGTAYVGYLPKTKVIGLSKINRVVDFFSRRPQIQERLTEQISATLRLILETEDVATVLVCTHMCVRMRGVRDDLSETTTSKMSGKFRTIGELRAEFFATTRQ